MFEIEDVFRPQLASTRPTQWEWDAIVDVAWNGPARSQFLSLVRVVKGALEDGGLSDGDRSAIAEQFRRNDLGISWLGPRREADAAMFLYGDYSIRNSSGVGTCDPEGTESTYPRCPDWLINQ